MMKIKVIIEKNKNIDEHFSFVVNEWNIGQFFDSFFEYFENFEDVNVKFVKLESEE